MNNNNTGGPAFPVHGGHYPDDDPRNRVIGGGMTLRDWFAGQAPNPPDDWMAIQRHADRRQNPYNEAHKPRARSDAELIAAYKFEVADAMIAERKK